MRFYVYHLQNKRAERIGPLLQQAFTGRASQPRRHVGADGRARHAGRHDRHAAVVPGAAGPVADPTPPPVGGRRRRPAAGRPAGGRGARRSGIVRNLQVVADKDNNTILIVATPAEYRVIEQALRKLDVPQRQVVIEVTIAEVTLTDELQFGVDWLFKGGAPSGRGTGGLLQQQPAFKPATRCRTTAADDARPAAALAQGFTYIINNANFPGGIQAVLRLLDTYGNTKVIANPHVAALDNQKATIKAGNRIPINQQTLVGGTTNAVTTTSQYIDTGVLLQVTPHINAGGLVTLDVQAEVSNPGNRSPIAGDAPPINTRSVQTLVVGADGQTMVMGGLINETGRTPRTGCRCSSRIPILGGLFGSQELKNNRTELVLFITPRVVENEVDLRGAIEDLRTKMENLDAAVPDHQADHRPGVPEHAAQPVGRRSAPFTDAAAVGNGDRCRGRRRPARAGARAAGPLPAPATPSGGAPAPAGTPSPSGNPPG